jgi:hypothetical protein
MAEYRNYWWQHMRNSKGNKAISSPTGIAPYDYGKRDNYSNHPADDSGGNFGRMSRTGIMDTYNKTTLSEPLLGIPAKDWVEFFKRYIS